VEWKLKAGEIASSIFFAREAAANAVIKKIEKSMGGERKVKTCEEFEARKAEESKLRTYTLSKLQSGRK